MDERRWNVQSDVSKSGEKSDAPSSGRSSEHFSHVFRLSGEGARAGTMSRLKSRFNLLLLDDGEALLEVRACTVLVMFLRLANTAT